MKIFKKCYVGVRLEHFDDSKPGAAPVGFLVPYEENSAGRKRMDTVDAWVSRNRPDNIRLGVVIDNTPAKGFRINGWNSRYSTDNKTALVIDPRGFELEIYIPNLTELIMNTTIINGEFQEELVWAREGSNNFLISANSKKYVDAWHEGVVLDPTVGDIVKDSHGTEYVYMGLKTATYHSNKKRLDTLPTTHSHRWALRKDTAWTELLDEKIQFTTEKPMYLYIKVNNSSTWEYGVLRKSKMKIEAITGKVDVLPDLSKHWDIGTYYHNDDGTVWRPFYDEVLHRHFTKTATFA